MSSNLNFSLTVIQSVLLSTKQKVAKKKYPLDNNLYSVTAQQVEFQLARDSILGKQSSKHLQAASFCERNTVRRLVLKYAMGP